MGVSENDGTQQPSFFLLKWSFWGVLGYHHLRNHPHLDFRMKLSFVKKKHPKFFVSKSLVTYKQLWTNDFFLLLWLYSCDLSWSSCRTLTPVIAKMLDVFNIALHLWTQLHSDQMSFTQKNVVNVTPRKKKQCPLKRAYIFQWEIHLNQLNQFSVDMFLTKLQLSPIPFVRNSFAQQHVFCAET